MADMKPMSREEALRRAHRLAYELPTYQQIAASIRLAMVTAPESGERRARQQDGPLATRGLADCYTLDELCGRLEILVDQLEAHSDTPIPPATEEAKTDADVGEVPYREVWSDECPPGGRVCSVCGQPVETMPCEEHSPLGYVVISQSDGVADIAHIGLYATSEEALRAVAAHPRFMGPVTAHAVPRQAVTG